MDDQKELLIWVLLSMLFGGMSASTAGIRKRINVAQTIAAVMVSLIFSAAAPFCFMALGMHQGWSIVTASLIGLLIFSLLAWVDKAEKRIPSIDPTVFLPSCLADKMKPKPPEEDKK